MKSKHGWIENFEKWFKHSKAFYLSILILFRTLQLFCHGLKRYVVFQYGGFFSFCNFIEIVKLILIHKHKIKKMICIEFEWENSMHGNDGNKDVTFRNLDWTFCGSNTLLLFMFLYLKCWCCFHCILHFKSRKKNFAFIF